MGYSRYELITSALKQFDEINCIYTFNNYFNGKEVINCNIVCDVDSITDNEELCMNIIAILEILRTLFEKNNIGLNYKIDTIDSFKEDLEDLSSETFNDYYVSNIIYSKADKKNYNRK